jgi:hypothetical protein
MLEEHNIRKTPFNRYLLDFDTARTSETAVYEFEENYCAVLASHHEKTWNEIRKPFNTSMILSAGILLYVSGLVQNLSLRVIEIGQLTGVVEIATLLLSLCYAGVLMKLTQVLTLDHLIRRYINKKYHNKFSRSFVIIKYLPTSIFTEVVQPKMIGFRSSGPHILIAVIFFISMLCFVLAVVMFPFVGIYVGIWQCLKNPALPGDYSFYIACFSAILIISMGLMTVLTFLMPFRYTIRVPKGTQLKPN